MKNIFIVFLLLLCNIVTMAVDHFVKGDGSADFATIAQVNAHTFVAGDNIYFNRGETFTGTILVRQAGASGNKITFGAYGTGANPVITGFETLSGWTNEGSGIYSKVITTESSVQTNMVTIDGVQYGMGRYPNTSFLTWESRSTNVSITDNAQTGTPNWTGSEIVLIKNAYVIDRCAVTSQTTSTLNYTSLGTTQTPNSTGNYFIQNSLSVLDVFGEWYHNTTNGKFYMYFGAIDPTTKTVKVATIKNNIRFSAFANYNTITDIDFTGSIETSVMATAAIDYLTFQNCNVSFAGLDGIWTDGETFTINNSTFNYCNRICIHSVDINATITNNTVTNNAIILGQGNIGTYGTSAIFMYSNNVTVTGNDIRNCATNGIFLNSLTDVGLVKNNYVYNTCIHNWDHGSIYTSNTHTDLNILDNIVVKSGGTGIYLDEYTSNTSVRGNSISECITNGIQLHKTNSDSIANNTIFNNTTGIFFNNSLSENNFVDMVLIGNKVVAKSATQKTISYYTAYASYAVSLASWNFSGNYYARPIDDTSHFYLNGVPSGGAKTLAQWKTFCTTDANALGSPKSVTIESDVMFAYNETNAPKVVNIDNPGMGLNGTTRYATSFTLPAYSGVVVIKDLLNPTGENKLTKSSTGKPLKTSSGLPIYTN